MAPPCNGDAAAAAAASASSSPPHCAFASARAACHFLAIAFDLIFGNFPATSVGIAPKSSTFESATSSSSFVWQ